MKNTPWYIAGLHFECLQCGRCCSGPAEGNIWITKPEIELIAKFLGMTIDKFAGRYLKRVHFRTSIVEHPETKDCIFLEEKNGRKTCRIYHVRPAQCRNWPFWADNLKNPAAWNRAAHKCPGVNRGKLYDCRQIRKIKNNKKWWLNSDL